MHGQSFKRRNRPKQEDEKRKHSAHHGVGNAHLPLHSKNGSKVESKWQHATTTTTNNLSRRNRCILMMIATALFILMSAIVLWNAKRASKFGLVDSDMNNAILSWKSWFDKQHRANIVLLPNNTHDTIEQDTNRIKASNDRKNTTLVVIIGSLRGGPLAWKTLFDNVLDVNGADLALMIGENPSNAHPSQPIAESPLHKRAKYIWTFPEFDDWADALKLVEPSGQWIPQVLSLVPNRTGLLGGVGTYRGSGAIIFMARWFLMKQLDPNNDQQILKQYDRFVITRSDHYYKCAHDLSKLDREYMWIPKGEDYGGISDRHLVAPRELILPALDLVHPLLHDPPPCSHFDINRGNFHFGCSIWHNPEQWIRYQWNRIGLFQHVRRMDRVMFTCAMPNDKTRWKKASEEEEQVVPEGVLLKYTAEYAASLATCASTQ